MLTLLFILSLTLLALSLLLMALTMKIKLPVFTLKNDMEELYASLTANNNVGKDKKSVDIGMLDSQRPGAYIKKQIDQYINPPHKDPLLLEYKAGNISHG